MHTTGAISLTLHGLFKPPLYLHVNIQFKSSFNSSKYNTLVGLYNIKKYERVVTGLTIEILKTREEKDSKEYVISTVTINHNRSDTRLGDNDPGV